MRLPDSPDIFFNALVAMHEPMSNEKINRLAAETGTPPADVVPKVLGGMWLAAVELYEELGRMIVAEAEEERRVQVVMVRVGEASTPPEDFSN